jgi:hypothetical protein
MARIVVERSFNAPPSDNDLEEVADRERPCREIRGVTWQRSVMSKNRLRMICEYEAPDAETVRKVQVEAGAPFDRIYPVDVIE